MQISAALVKELRGRTGAGMMECKKALVASEGNVEQALDAMRRDGQAKADKKASRIAAEGLVAFAIEGNKAAIAEVNCETDFVAKEQEFQDFLQTVTNRVLAQSPADVAALAEISMDDADGPTVEERRRELVAKIGENISVRRFATLETSDGSLGSYLHGGRIGVLVELDGGNADIARDIAMHVAASNPVCVSESEVPADDVAREKAILVGQAADSGKPEAIIEKMVAGRMRKYFADITLLGQAFVKEPDLSVEKYLKQHDCTVRRFVRYEVGEGMEKRSENFAEEVQAQVQGS